MLDKDTQYKILTAGAALLAGVVVKAALTATWRAIKDSDPPQNPESDDVSWGEAITWTIASSVAMGVGSLLARRGAASFLPKPYTGDEPLI
jgi:hypothetical protein